MRGPHHQIASISFSLSRNYQRAWVPRRFENATAEYRAELYFGT